VPAARFWTLSLVDRQGFPIDNAAQRFGFRSSEVLRDADGSFQVTVAPVAQAGNWLPVGAQERYNLVLRLYDSPVSATAAAIDRNSLPGITRETCP
jgi:hypothetical protein